MRALTAAFGLFTVIPVPPVAEIDRRVAGRAIVALPWVGLVLGAAAGCLLWITGWLGGGQLLGAALALALLAGATGALHLDGLADTADGLGSRKPAAEALIIMRKSDIGPMGVVTLLFALLLAVAALASLPTLTAALAVAVAATVGRVAIVMATVSTRSARQEGFGALFTGVTSRRSALLTVVLCAAVAAAAGFWSGGWPGTLGFVAALAVALTVGALWARHLRTRLGGLTGDTFGSISEVTHVVFLIVIALV